MNVYNYSTLIAFYGKHPDCKQTLQKWYHDVMSMQWKRPGYVTKSYTTARAIKYDRIIFKINENEYRIIAEINYIKGWMFIKFIGTHAEYDKIDAETVNFFKPKSNK